MSDKKTAILLVNVGSPDNPSTDSVKKFLVEFLNDKRVIDLPWLLRKILVNLIIIPARVKKSSQLYEKLFTKNGSPLIYYSEKLKNKLQQKVAPGNKVFVGMRYGNPGFKQALQKIKKENFDRIIVFPLFPHYAMSTTETAVQAIKAEIQKQNCSAQSVFVPQFYNHPRFIKSIKERADNYDLSEYDHVVFSFHGIPFRQIRKIHPGQKVTSCTCDKKFPEHGKNCYRATCYQTARLLAKELNLEPNNFTVAFQSRLSKNWLTPFTDEVLLKLAKNNKKRVLIFTPSFVNDCLETSIEINVEYKKLFLENGGLKLQLVPGLNATESWAETVFQLIQETLIDLP